MTSNFGVRHRDAALESADASAHSKEGKAGVKVEFRAFRTISNFPRTLISISFNIFDPTTLFRT